VLRQQRLAETRSDRSADVRLRQFNVVVLGLVVEPLVVIVDGDRGAPSWRGSADHVIVRTLQISFGAECRRGDFTSEDLFSR